MVEEEGKKVEKFEIILGQQWIGIQLVCIFKCIIPHK
jgi:hypothetical protein